MSRRGRVGEQSDRPRRAPGPTSVFGRIQRGTAAFSLVEVLVALGILGSGLVAVLAMFAPLARVERENDEQLAAVGAAAAVNGYLRERPFDEAPGALGQSFFVSRSGARVGRAGGAEWLGREQEEFFEVVPLPGEPRLDANAMLPWLGFSLRVRWPVSAIGDGGQRELIIPGSLHR